MLAYVRVKMSRAFAKKMTCRLCVSIRHTYVYVCFESAMGVAKGRAKIMTRRTV